MSKTIHEVSNMPKPITDYIEFLNETDVTRDKMVTKPRIKKNIDKWAEVINTFLVYPDKFVDMLSPKKSDFNLYFSQRITLRVMARHRQSYHTYTRGYSKSFLAFLSRYITTMLTPNHKSFIVAGTKTQATQIAKEKVVQDLWVKFPLLENEMQKMRRAGQVKNAYVMGQDYAEFRFTHGGVFDVVGSGAGVRGGRRHSGIFEEVIEHDPIEINERILPLMNKQRETYYGEINPKEPHGSKIFVTTAGFQGTYAYEKLIETVCYSVIDPDRYAVFGGSYEIPLMHGLLDPQQMKENISSPSFDSDSMDREYVSRWSGSPVGAAFSTKTVEDLRKIVRADRTKKKDPHSNESFYVISADMAKDGSANTAVVVYHVQPREYAFMYKNVNLFEIASTDYSKVSIEIKKAIESYEARLLVYDANGIGAALRDWLNKDQIDEESNRLLPALGIINPPEDSKRDVMKTTKDRQICYEIKATGGTSGHIHKIFFSKISTKNVRFLIKSAEAIEKFKQHKNFKEASSNKMKKVLRPYFTMDRLQEEMRNLDIVDVGDNANPNALKVKRRNSKIQKDFFSAAEYGIYAVHNLYEVPHYTKKNKRKNKLSEYIIHAKGV